MAVNNDEPEALHLRLVLFGTMRYLAGCCKKSTWVCGEVNDMTSEPLDLVGTRPVVLRQAKLPESAIFAETFQGWEEFGSRRPVLCVAVAECQSDCQ